MKNNTETIVDDNGIEILVNYDWDKDDLELKSVEVVIAGIGIPLLSVLTLKQKTFIISKLSYED